MNSGDRHFRPRDPPAVHSAFCTLHSALCSPHPAFPPACHGDLSRHSPQDEAGSRAVQSPIRNPHSAMGVPGTQYNGIKISRQGPWGRRFGPAQIVPGAALRPGSRGPSLHGNASNPLNLMPLETQYLIRTVVFPEFSSRSSAARRSGPSRWRINWCRRTAREH